MNIFTSKKRIVNSFPIPIMIMSLYLFAVALLGLPRFVELENGEVVESLLWCAVCGGFFASKVSRDSVPTVVTLCGVLCECFAYYLLTGKALGFGVICISAYFAAKYLSELEMKYLLFVGVGCGFVLGVLLGAVNPLFERGVKALASLIGDNAFAFGALNETYTVLFGSLFSDLFYYKDFSTASIINERLITGAVNVFSQDTSNPASVTSTFLTGRYYATIFLPIGIYASLYKKLKDRFTTPLFLALLVSVLLGNNILFLIFVLFYNPFVFIAFSLCDAIASLGASLTDARVGFTVAPSVFEMVKNINDVGYFLAVGFVCTVLVFFASKYAVEKYDFDSYKPIAPCVKKLVDALGGKENIEKIDSDCVIVYNPNLINILKIDCDICENRIMLSEDDLKTLSDNI